MNRRTMLAGLVVGTGTGLAGCTFGEERHRSVSIENRSPSSRETTVTITSTPGPGQGHTEYFDASAEIADGGRKRYGEAIDVSDGPPQHVWIKIRIDGDLVIDGEYAYPEDSIRMVIGSARDVAVTVDP